MLAAIPRLITREYNNNPIKPFSYEEIHQAIFSMGKYKAPGPDGFPTFFFHKYWHIVGEDVIAVVREFQTSNSLLKK